MGFITFLFYLLLAYLGLRVFWSLFGPAIARWLVITFVRKVQEQAEKQANARARSSSGYAREFYVAPDLKATVQPQPERKADPRKASALADADVEFEEVKEPR